MGNRVVFVLASVALSAGILAGCEPGPSPWHNELVSVDASGAHSANGTSFNPVLSPDGTKVAFLSYASNLGPVDTVTCDNGSGQMVPCTDVYVRDLTTGVTSLVSANAAGTNGGNMGTSGQPVFSPDGTKIVFGSESSDLVADDTNNCPLYNGAPDRSCSDVFVRDLETGVTTLVSVNAAGTATADGYSGAPAFSPDGTKVAFLSYAGNLGPVDTAKQCYQTIPVQQCGDLYVRDLTTGVTSLVSVNKAGTDSANSFTWRGLFSPDGTKIAFMSEASDLVAPDTDHEHDVFVRDLTTGVTSLVSVNAAGTSSGNGLSVDWDMSFSPDSTRLAFISSAGDLVGTDTNGLLDVFVRDFTTGTTTLVSANAPGTDTGNDSSSFPAFSPDGQHVAFTSQATDLGPADDNGTASDVFLRDLTTGTTSLVSVDAGGTGPGNAESQSPVFSPDGTKISFMSRASDLGARDTAICTYRASLPWDPPILKPCTDVYVRDLTLGTTTLASARADGTDGGDRDSSGGQFNPVTGQVLIYSGATNLVPGDENGTSDVFLATLHGANLSVELSGDVSSAGDAVTYTLRVANSGPDTADGASVILAPPAEADGFIAPPSCEALDQIPALRCDLGDLAAGDDATVTIGANSDLAPGTTVTAHARATSSVSELDARDNLVSLDTDVP
jgi:Tol biopolymer transport system component